MNNLETGANKTRAFLAEIDRFANGAFPSEVLSRAKESLLDYVGVAYAGRASMAEQRRELVERCDKGRFLTVGEQDGYAFDDAVFLNGLYAHALDFDDGVNQGIIHLGSPIFSVLLPLAEDQGSSGYDLLRSAVIGYETAWTLAISVQPEHKKRGFHATGTCGMLGAIVAASYLLNMTQEERFKAFSVGLCSATGTLKVLEDGSDLKPYNVAKAALLAAVSLKMACAGFNVPDDAFSGSRGFLALATGDENRPLASPLKDGLFAMQRTYTKPYAACRYCHPAIEAAITLGAALEQESSQVEHIAVKTYDLAVFKHDHTDIKGESSAKMSIPYGVAVGFIAGKAGLSEYSEEMVCNQRVLDLTQKVSVVADDCMSAAFPSKTIAEVTIQLVSGETVTKTVTHPKGEPENPLGLQGVCDKFREMVGYANMPNSFSDEVIACVLEVESQLPQLFALLKRGA